MSAIGHKHFRIRTITNFNWNFRSTMSLEPVRRYHFLRLPLTQRTAINSWWNVPSMQRRPTPWHQTASFPSASPSCRQRKRSQPGWDLASDLNGITIPTLLRPPRARLCVWRSMKTAATENGNLLLFYKIHFVHSPKIHTGNVQLIMADYCHASDAGRHHTQNECGETPHTHTQTIEFGCNKRMGWCHCAIIHSYVNYAIEVNYYLVVQHRSKMEWFPIPATQHTIVTLAHY